ncbi:DUF72 domain-containing protein [Robbsia andropogonis]|uniref:DUF72 domain-containing protein n=1 Tax=Robbsia andropogonis TaxID=28092 RepID=UPI00046486BE|nr:DUF72 domain-containing protein [Robbsia andropogonis]MCP1116715.1 DUF72 domain-containing protein [Robbsia andropogonis]MCP1126606.1 DUF72 domain-containing protein [Robbsia andropogonis]
MTAAPDPPDVDAQASLFDLPSVDLTPDTPIDAGGARATSNGAAPRTRPAKPLPAIGTATPPHPFLAAAAAALPERVHLGTSSWSFPGWEGLLYDRPYSTEALAHGGLAAYAAHPLLRTVGIDRSFYAPLSIEAYQDYASQVPSDFRFLVKAPAAVCDAAIRGPRGMPSRANPAFLDVEQAIETFVHPCLTGLGSRVGPMVFQLSPLTDAQLADPAALIDRLGRFFAALPALDDAARRNGACYALELRDAGMLTPRLIKMLHARQVRYCVGVHARMPDVSRQSAALAMLDGQDPRGAALPLVVRWNLHAGMRYEGAKTRYEPFDAIIDPDVTTRQAVAALILRYLRAGQSSFIVINNKAEGSSPLSCAWLASALAVLYRDAATQKAE